MEFPQQATLIPYVSADKWRGINVAHYLVPGLVHLRDPQVNGHRVVFNMGNPLYVKWKDHRGWQGKIYDTGALTIVPDQEGNEVTSSKELRATVITLQPSYADQLFEKSNIRISQYRGIKDNRAHQLALALGQELQYGSLASQVLGDSLSVALTMHLVTHYAELPEEFRNPKGKLSLRQLKSVIDYCREMIGMPISLGDLSAVANVSVFHFLRQFKRSLGYTPHQYLLKLRIERAAQLLKIEKMPLIEVAFVLGFTDQAHFSKAFKKMTGLTPKDLI